MLIVTFALAAFTLNEMATPISAIITQFSTGTLVVQNAGPVVITYTSVGYKGCTNFVFNHKFFVQAEGILPGLCTEADTGQVSRNTYQGRVLHMVKLAAQRRTGEPDGWVYIHSLVTF